MTLVLAEVVKNIRSVADANIKKRIVADNPFNFYLRDCNSDTAFLFSMLYPMIISG